MELTSAALHKGRTPWRGLLLTASLLTCWTSPATAQVSVEAVPPHVDEGTDVLLLVHNVPARPRVFYWYKGDNQQEIIQLRTATNETTTDPAFSGRVTIFLNGSLLLQNVTQSDTGVYRLQILTENLDLVKTCVQVHVYASLLICWTSPATAHLTVEAVPPHAGEGTDVLLLVHSVPARPRVFYWYKGDNQQEIIQLKTDTNEITTDPAFSSRVTIFLNGSLLLQNVTQSDAGVYRLQILTENLDLVKTCVQFRVYPSLLTCWTSPATAHLTVEAVPPHAGEGTDVLLLVHNVPARPQGFYWYKGDNQQIIQLKTATNEITTDPAFSGRVTIFLNGSLLLQNVTQSDAGVYQLQILTENLDLEKIYVQFRVYPSLLTCWTSPATAHMTVETVSSHVYEGKDVLLLVHNVPARPRAFYWYKGDNQQEIIRLIIDTNEITTDPELRSRATIYHNGSLLFRKVTQSDAGVYRLQILTENLDLVKTCVQFRVFSEKHN